MTAVTRPAASATWFTSESRPVVTKIPAPPSEPGARRGWGRPPRCRRPAVRRRSAPPARPRSGGAATGPRPHRQAPAPLGGQARVGQRLLHQVAHLVPGGGRSLAHDLAPGAVDQDEVGRHRDLVVRPRLGGQHRGHRTGSQLAQGRLALGLDPLGHDHRTGSARDLEPGIAERLPEPATGEAGAGQEGQQGEVLRPDHCRADGLAEGIAPGHVEGRRVRLAGLRHPRHRLEPSARGGVPIVVLVAALTFGGIGVEVHPEVVQRAEDLGMAAQDPGHQQGQEPHGQGEQHDEHGHLSAPEPIAR